MNARRARESLAALRAWLATRLRHNLSLDLRALALFRIAFGALVISDVVARSADLVAHYSDAGWLPRVAAGDPPLLNAYFLRGDPTYVGVMMVVTCVVALSMSLGFRSRLCAALCWWLLGSLHTRCWPVNQGGDDLIRNMLFFAAFTPLGARWSVDRWLQKKRVPDPPQRALGATTMVLYGQLFVVYFVTSTMKANHAHWWLGDAVYHALSADHFVTEIGEWLYPHAYLLKGLTWSTLALELVGPFLLILGPPTARFRGGLFIAFVALHAGIAASLHVGIFSAISAAAWLFTMPSAWMDALERLVRQPVTPASLTRPASPLALRIIATVVFAHVVVGGVVEDRFPAKSTFRNHFLWPGNALGLKRRWALFISPRKNRGWIVIEGVTADGAKVDFVRGRAPVSFDPPQSFYRVFDNQRWRKMLMRFQAKDKAGVLQTYLSWVCRTHDDVNAVTYWYMKRDFGAHYDHGPVQKTRIGSRSCVADRPRAVAPTASGGAAKTAPAKR